MSKVNAKMVLFVVIAFILLSMVPIFQVTWQRVLVEGQARAVEFILDSEEVWQMVMRDPSADEEDYLQAIADFYDAGVEALAVYPVSFGRLEERGLAITYDAKTFAQVFYGGNLPEIAEQLEAPLISHWYVVVPDEELGQHIIDVLGEGDLTDSWRFIWGDDRWLIEIPSIYWNDIRRAGLWFDQDEIDQAMQVGYRIVPRVSAVPGESSEQLFKRMRPLVDVRDAVSMVLPTGSNLPGTKMLGNASWTQYTTAQDFIDMCQQHQWLYGLIENMNQLDSIRFTGDTAILEQSDYQAVRVYAIQRAELDKDNWLDFAGITDRWFRAVVDRNIRGIYVRLFHGTLTDPERILSVNRDMVRASVAQISEAGYPMQQPVALQSLHLRGRMMLLAPSLALSGALLCFCWYPWRKPYGPVILTLLALLAVGGIAYLSFSEGTLVGRWVTMRQAFALAAHLAFPTLAGVAAVMVIELLPRQAKPLQVWVQGVLLAFLCFDITLAGGLVLGNILTDNIFMLELDYFRGVKLSYVLPIALFAVVFFLRYGFVLQPQQQRKPRSWQDFYTDITSLMKRPLTLGLLTALGVVAIGGWYYLGRSGHEAGVAISSIELQLRSMLESLLTARPRNKEFLIGYPALMLMPFLWQKRNVRWLILPMGIASMTGLISVVNSFAHIRTPLMISIERSFYGLLFGIVVGSVALVVCWLLHRLAAATGLFGVQRDE